jgi:hypothetical protein
MGLNFVHIAVWITLDVAGASTISNSDHRPQGPCYLLYSIYILSTTCNSGSDNTQYMVQEIIVMSVGNCMKER